MHKTLAFGLLAMGLPVWAGRPVSTDDASVNDRGICQLEGWVDRANDARHSHIAPACGVYDGLELGAEWDLPAPASVAQHGISASLKWAPEFLGWNGWRFGAKAGLVTEKAFGETERHFGHWTALALASYPINDRWTIHLNLGHSHPQIPVEKATTYGGALVYAINDRTMAFAEWQGDSRTPATRVVGVRWWLLSDVLGLDLTTSEGNATPHSRGWGLGLGWYGLHF
ncbi:MAG: hypothetical protein KGL57_03150 [Burkholderiales bacterium]|nr:hypothetical protein [Burkholderiales bacterium]